MRRARLQSTRARFVVAAGELLPFNTAAFEACRMERTLQHVRDPDAVVDEILRVLRPGGRVALLEPDWETLLIAGADDTVSATIWGRTSGATETLESAAISMTCSLPET